ncbi:MAG: DUF948 domain-containing protein [Bacteroidota bacterium]|nr:DUF948 domain-containing protein [Bacteroidota bacterium]
MINKFVISIVFVVLMSCQPRETNQNELLTTIDSLKMDVRDLKKQLDSMKHSSNNLTQTEINQKSEKTETFSVEKEIAIKYIEPQLPQIKYQKKKNDTVYYYFNNNKLSVKVCPRVNDKQWILVYSIKGTETIRFESVIQSYSITYDLKFRPNGSLETVVENTNPGASLHWYKCNISFNEQNEPLWKVCQEYPITRLEHPDKNKYYWDKKSMNWVKQEIVIEQEVPKN